MRNRAPGMLGRVRSFAFLLLLVVNACARTGLDDGPYASKDASGAPDALQLVGNARAIAAGAGTACALTADARVWCWGDNLYGQLGSSTIPGSAVPSPVGGLPSDVVSIAAGFSHMCALTAEGRALCWGNDEWGQLGDGKSSSFNPTAVTVDVPAGIAMIAGGEDHTCVVTEAGAALCWGSNGHGQLGDGTMTDSASPVPVKGLSTGVLAITAGFFHTCAITASHAAVCWGDNDFGQLGDGTTVQRSVPTPVVGLSTGVTAIDAGRTYNSYATCAVTSDGVGRCWGTGELGQLGDGSTIDSAKPVPVEGLAGVEQVSIGGDHACAVLSTHDAFCWGEGGLVGDGSSTMRSVPVPIPGLSSTVSTLAVGGDFTCAVTLTGGVACWGNDDSGELGDGQSFGESLVPQPVVGLP